MKKRLLIENDINKLDDFQKILLLNKGKLSYDDVEFKNSEGVDFGNIIEVTQSGLIFNFDDLEQFLKFFFPNEYVGGDEGEWDARNYDLMYYNSYDWSSECWDRSSDDWREGYTLGYLCTNAIVKLKELIGIIAPSGLKNFSEDGTNIVGEADEITKILSAYFKDIDDEIDSVLCDAKDTHLRNVFPSYIEDKYCDSLKPFGIENWGGKIQTCFRTYFLSWGNLIQMFLYDGDFSENALDTMFKYLKNFRGHPPSYYELEYEIFDSSEFEKLSCDGFVEIIDGYIEDAMKNSHPEYIETMDKLNSLNLFNPKKVPGTVNTFIKVKTVDIETLLAKYVVGEGLWQFNAKYGVSPVDEVISIATQPGLFNPTEFRVDPKPNQL